MIALCFDIGGSKYMAGLVTGEGRVLCALRREWETLTPEGVVASLIGSGREMLAQHPEYRPEAVGVTIPGLANPEEGLWVEASFSGIRNLPSGGLLREAFGLPVYAENDARACALAEKLFGLARETDHFLYVTVSNGVGGAAFVDGRLLYGAGAAGECGHVTVEEDGRPCKCGKKGCLEAYAAGPGIARTYAELTGEDAGGEAIARRARDGEAAALEVFRREGVYLGRMIGMAVNLLSPSWSSSAAGCRWRSTCIRIRFLRRWKATCTWPPTPACAWRRPRWATRAGCWARRRWRRAGRTDGTATMERRYEPCA
jgi:glucokinase